MIFDLAIIAQRSEITWKWVRAPWRWNVMQCRSSRQLSILFYSLSLLVCVQMLLTMWWPSWRSKGLSSNFLLRLGTHPCSAGTSSKKVLGTGRSCPRQWDSGSGNSTVVSLPSRTNHAWVDRSLWEFLTTFRRCRHACRKTATQPCRSCLLMWASKRLHFTAFWKRIWRCQNWHPSLHPKYSLTNKRGSACNFAKTTSTLWRVTPPSSTVSSQGMNVGWACWRLNWRRTQKNGIPTVLMLTDQWKPSRTDLKERSWWLCFLTIKAVFWSSSFHLVKLWIKTIIVKYSELWRREWGARDQSCGEVDMESTNGSCIMTMPPPTPQF